MAQQLRKVQVGGSSSNINSVTDAMLARKGDVDPIIDVINALVPDPANISLDLTGDLTVAGTTTLNGTLVLGDAASDSLTVNATVTQGAPVNYSNATTISAGATQTQAGATALTEEINNVTTVATAGDGVKLPAAVAGQHIYVKNSGATALAVYPATSDSIDALAVNLAVRLQPGSAMDFYAKDATVWESSLDASLTLNAPTTASGQLELKAADSAGNTVTTITNASQAAARTYTIPDAGASASFVMTAGAQSLAGVKTFSDATASTSKDTGGVVLEGGLGVEKEIFAGLAISTLTTVKTGDGTVSVPSYSFTSDPNTGIYSSAANVLGLVTDGTERWVVNGSGALNPTSNNVNDIGNGSVNVRDVNISRGIKAYGDALVGTRGIVDATCTLETTGDGRDFVSVVTLTNFIVGDMGSAAAAKAFGNKIFAFPAGAHVTEYAYMSLGFTGAGTANTPDVGLGSIVGVGAVADLGTVGATAEDYIDGQTANDIAGTAEVFMQAPDAAIQINMAAEVKDVFLNAASTWAADNIGNLTATGTVSIKWTKMS